MSQPTPNSQEGVKGGEAPLVKGGESPWDELPTALETYRTFVHLWDEKCDITELNPVCAHASTFYPLSTFEGPAYCNVVHISNMKNVDIVFELSTKYLHGILGRVRTFSSGENKLLVNGRTAFRTIVPQMYQKCSQLAGPLGVHEHIIDGQRVPERRAGKKNASLMFVAHPESWLVIMAENCTGTWKVTTPKDELVIFNLTKSPNLIFQKFDS